MRLVDIDELGGGKCLRVVVASVVALLIVTLNIPCHMAR